MKPVHDQLLMPIQDFRDQCFQGRAPCLATIKRWIADRKILGEKIGRRYYVYVTADTRPIINEALLSANAVAKATQTGNALAEAVMMQWLQSHGQN